MSSRLRGEALSLVPEADTSPLGPSAWGPLSFFSLVKIGDLGNLYASALSASPVFYPPSSAQKGLVLPKNIHVLSENATLLATFSHFLKVADRFAHTIIVTNHLSYHGLFRTLRHHRARTLVFHPENAPTPAALLSAPLVRASVGRLGYRNPTGRALDAPLPPKATLFPGASVTNTPARPPQSFAATASTAADTCPAPALRNTCPATRNVVPVVVTSSIRQICLPSNPASARAANAPRRFTRR